MDFGLYGINSCDTPVPLLTHLSLCPKTLNIIQQVAAHLFVLSLDPLFAASLLASLASVLDLLSDG